MIDGTMYETQQKNQKYDDQKCKGKGHAHVMQIRHGVNFSLVKSLHEFAIYLFVAMSLSGIRDTSTSHW